MHKTAFHTPKASVCPDGVERQEGGTHKIKGRRRWFRVEFAMIHLVVLAMIDLWDIDASASQPPAAQFGQRLAGAGSTSDALLNSSDALGPSPIKVCTYGAPPLGPQLFSDATGLARAFTTPACDDGSSAFQSGLAAQSLMDFLPLGMVLPWSPSFAPGIPVTLPGRTATSPSGSATGQARLAGPSSVHLPPVARESWATSGGRSARPSVRRR